MVPAQKLQSELSLPALCFNEVLGTTKDHSPSVSICVSQSSNCSGEAGTQDVCPPRLLTRQSQAQGGRKRK